MLSALWLVSFAHAGEIQVLTRTPVVVAVDGQILQYPEGSTAVTASDLAGGAHLVEVRTMLGKPVANTTIDVPVNQQVRLQYADRTLTVLGSGMLPRDPTPAPAPPPPEPPKHPAMREDLFTS